MSQPDLFGNEPPQVRMTLVIEDQPVTDGVPRTRVEVWSAPRDAQQRLLGVVDYHGAGHDLLPGFLGEVWLRWEYETIPDFRRWLKDQHISARRWGNSHPYGTQGL